MHKLIAVILVVLLLCFCMKSNGKLMTKLKGTELSYKSMPRNSLVCDTGYDDANKKFVKINCRNSELLN